MNAHWTWMPGYENKPSPCMTCKPPERHENCHSSCSAYAKYRSEIDRERQSKVDAEKGNIPFNWKTNRRRGQS